MSPRHYFIRLRATTPVLSLLLSVSSTWQPLAQAQTGPAPKAAAAEGRDYFTVTRERFLDTSGFEQPVEAFSLLLPKGWKREGGVLWGSVQGCRGELVRPVVKATSPDGLFQFELFPTRSFNASDDAMMRQTLQAGAQAGGCQMNAPFSARQYAEGFVRRDLGGEPANIRDDEQRMVTARKFDQQANSVAAQYGGNSQQQTTMAYADISWQGRGEGILHTSTTVMIQRQPNYVSGGSTSFATTSANAILMRFPSGRRAEGARIMSMIMSSQRINPIWQEAKNRFMTQLGNIEQRGRIERIRLMGEQARAYAEARNAASNQSMRSWERLQDSQDRQHQSFVQAIREVETWRGADGRVELSAGYEKAWSRGDGSYILSNKAGFDPAAAFQDQQWKPMQREQ